MSDQLLIVERLLPASLERVWRALTNKEEMKKWYFALSEFIPEPGFRFSFTGGPEDGTQYVHLCEITEVVPEQKLTYSWRYEGYDGISYVTFELEEQGVRLCCASRIAAYHRFRSCPISRGAISKQAGIILSGFLCRHIFNPEGQKKATGIPVALIVL
ncbi:MAG: SRPBCC domain-containing protein [Chitinophagaceae bacterium]